MINIHDYFAINWEATSDNIRAFLNNHVSNKVFADAMCVTERTVYNWTHNKSNPPIDKLILIAKFFNVDLFDILILNGQLEDSITRKDWSEAEAKSIHHYKYEDLNNRKVCYDIKSEKEVISNIIFNEYVKSNYPITNLNEFLLSLPLFDLEDLSDMLYRINGNIGTDNNYVLEKLSYLYSHVPNDKAKQFVEYYKEYYLKYPSINIVDEETTMDLKSDKYLKSLEIFSSKAFTEMFEAYQTKLQTFLYRLKA